MATVQGMTPEEILENINETIVAASIDGSGDIILSTKGGSTYNGGRVRGDTGPTGIPGPTGPIGPTGPDGVGIASIAVTYQASTSGTVIPTGTWLTSPPLVPDNQFLWTRNRITYTNGAATNSYSVVKQGAIFDSGWVNITTFYNGWVNFETGTNARTAQVRRIGDHVKFQGLVKSGAQGDAFLIPTGFRPQSRTPAEHHLPFASNGSTVGMFLIWANGVVQISGGSNVWVDLSSIDYFLN